MTDRNKQKTYSFVNTRNNQVKKSSRFDNDSPQKSEGRAQKYQHDMFNVRFKRKDLKFEPKQYVTSEITIDDVNDLKEVFDTYDSTGMGVLLPGDLKLLLTQNDFQPNKKTLYEIVAQFDTEDSGGISFSEFMCAMDCKPYKRENKADIISIFKKYDRANKGYLNLQDLTQINRHVKENIDDETLKVMLEKSDSNRDGKVSFDDFYSVMVKNNTY